MARCGRSLLPAALAIAGFCLVLTAPVAPAEAGRGGMLGTAYRRVSGVVFHAAVDHAMLTWDSTLAGQLAAAQWRVDRAALASGVEAFLTGDYARAQDLLAGAKQSFDDMVAAKATRLADLASTWSQALSPLVQVETGDPLLELRLPRNQEVWGRGALPHIRQWVAAYRSLHPDAATRPLALVFVAKLEDLAALMQVESRMLEKSGTVASTLFGHIVLLSPGGFGNGYYWPRVLCHEMVHWLLHLVVHASLPPFVEEGAAIWLEEWGLKGRSRVLSAQDRMLLALAPSALASELGSHNRPFVQCESPASARLRFLLAWWHVRKAWMDKSPQQILGMLASGASPGVAAQPSDVSELLAFAQKEGAADKPPIPKEAPVAIAYAFYPELLPERYAKTLEETRKQIYLADLLWGRNHRQEALTIYLGLPEPAQMTPEVFWRIVKLKAELGPAAAGYELTDAVLALFPEDPRVLYAASTWASSQLELWNTQEARLMAWLTNPFARETQGMVQMDDTDRSDRRKGDAADR